MKDDARAKIIEHLQELINENIFLRDENRRLNDELTKIYAENPDYQK